MRTCGRILDATGGFWGFGGPHRIEDPPPQGNLPHINLNHNPAVVKRGMGSPGTIETPPLRNSFWTNDASGGCVPICAAEIDSSVQNVRTVRWLYLVHGTSMNLGLDITARATNPDNIYVVFLCNSETILSLDQALTREIPVYMPHLDPGNRIDNQHAMLIYAPSRSLAITPVGSIGLLHANGVVPPKPEKKGFFKK
jgi:hypothetical protein